MAGQLGVHPALQDGLDQLGQEPALTGQREPVLVDPGHQLIEQLVGEQFLTQ